MLKINFPEILGSGMSYDEKQLIRFWGDRRLIVGHMGKL